MRGEGVDTQAVSGYSEYINNQNVKGNNMYLLRDYWDYELSCIFSNLLKEQREDIMENYDNFTVVDGEEGDYGAINYLDNGGNIVAIKTIFGGDKEELEFTEYGKKLMNEKLILAMNKLLSVDNT